MCIESERSMSQSDYLNSIDYIFDLLPQVDLQSEKAFEQEKQSQKNITIDNVVKIQKIQELENYETQESNSHEQKCRNRRKGTQGWYRSSKFITSMKDKFRPVQNAQRKENIIKLSYTQQVKNFKSSQLFITIIRVNMSNKPYLENKQS
ncbi:unnamed protein product (macronuclear) [Paramecium tetraurelia]|uniref:Uncharacterized protein n=1 Tax=Paramecium tetraurelia TaxID=5888 RepID=A0EGG0_PARTE|nr:uncharacterized protein GSPATT00026725001 [Paramecium tetraurelia]CAK94401.1 unnamed protein product [Paramecium tetraurelia]|eukprot:XP_001461774.1 hypothetical protein (macronuclear) [Paramecium tetraurelia strain d4-2]